MSEETGGQSEAAWLLEPPGRGEVHLNIALGSDVELSPEGLAALETLMRSLEESEVSGFDFSDSAKCPGYRICSPYGVCQPLTSTPLCVAFVHCRIAGVQ